MELRQNTESVNIKQQGKASERSSACVLSACSSSVWKSEKLEPGSQLYLLSYSHVILKGISKWMNLWNKGRALRKVYQAFQWIMPLWITHPWEVKG